MILDKETALEVSDEMRAIVAQGMTDMMEKHGGGTNYGAWTVSSGAMTALIEGVAKCIVVFPRNLHQQITTDVVNSLISMRKIANTSFEEMMGGDND